MPEENRPTLLIVEDDLDMAEMLNSFFSTQGYDVMTVNWGEDAIRACQTSLPDAVILDIRLPDIDGYEVARRLRTTRRTENVPIIFLTEKRERMDRLKGLELRAEDYIAKPFDIQELRLRVRNVVSRANRAAVHNPVTGLPDGLQVDEHLDACMQRTGWRMLILSLKNLERFHELYGFVAADDLMRAVALMIQDEINQTGNGNDFLGHLTPSDFLITTTLPAVEPLKQKLLHRLEQSFDYFYQEQDREKDAFRDRRLGVQVLELNSTLQFRNKQELKSELERMIQAGVH